MSPKAQALLIDSLGRRWSQRSAPSAGTTCIATMAADSGMPKGRHIVDCIVGSVINKTAAPVTFTASVRDLSIAGTVLADADFIADSVAAAAGAGNVAFQLNAMVPGIRGNAMVVDLSGPNASVIQKVTATGWTEALE